MRIRWVPDDAAADLTLALAEAISERTTVVCISAVQFATGTQVDVAALVARARRAGARVVVDVTQMAGASPVTMSQWGADALVCSGYKWLSVPGGVALLAVTGDLASGSEDGTHQAAFGLKARIPNCEMKILYGAGHACQIEQPGPFNHNMIEFLNAHGLFPADAR